jgi:uncharacterized membrane protein
MRRNNIIRDIVGRFLFIFGCMIRISNGFILRPLCTDCICSSCTIAIQNRIQHQQLNFVSPSSHKCGITWQNIPTKKLVPCETTGTRIVHKQPFHLFVSLIGVDDVWGNWATLSGIAALAQILGRKTMIGKLLGPPVTAMALSFVAATIGILHPGGTIAAKSLQLLSLQYATPFILLGADFRDAITRCGPLLLSFGAASISTIVACCVGWVISGSGLTMSLGRDGLAIAAALLAKNVGGGINYLAVCRSLNASPNAVAAGLCVDNIFALLYFPATSILANGRPDVVIESDSGVNPINNDAYTNIADKYNTNESVQRISTVIFLSTILLWFGEKIGRESGSLPACTVLTVLFASCTPSSWITPMLQKTANELGLVTLYLFFATAGAPGIAVAQSVRTSLIPLTTFLTCLYTIHGTILFLLHKVLGAANFGGAFQPQRLLVSSSAAIGGPATAVALATEAKWKSLMVPSLIVGNIGYAIATFCGLVFYSGFSRYR